MAIQMMDGNPQENLPFKHCKKALKEVLRRENQGLKVYPVDGS
jgi:hypothetical protein